MLHLISRERFAISNDWLMVAHNTFHSLPPKKCISFHLIFDKAKCGYIPRSMGRISCDKIEPNNAFKPISLFTLLDQDTRFNLPCQTMLQFLIEDLKSIRARVELPRDYGALYRLEGILVLIITARFRSLILKKNF